MPRKANLPRLIWDRQHLLDNGSAILLASPIGWTSFDAAGFTDGPATEIVRVIDQDEATGTPRPGARWLPRGVGLNTGCYDVSLPHPDEREAFLRSLEEDAFLQVSPFATVLHTIRFFESPDALGRPVSWAFPRGPLRIVPRARLEANAFYDRLSGSLEFGYFFGRSGRKVYTALSHDIVVHETTHAILDGVAPDLYHATRTESLALHEALADLAAIVLTLLNEMVLFSLTHISSGNLDVASALSKVAEEFGSEVQTTSGVDALRVLMNRSSLADLADPTDHYAASEILSGAAFQAFVHCASVGRYFDERRAIAAAKGVARLVFRALDYLPPGEASLTDFARAVAASSRAVSPSHKQAMRWFKHELTGRGLIREPSELEDQSAQVGRVIEGVNCESLLLNQAEAEDFAERHRELLGVPPGTTFRVRPRRQRLRSRSRRGDRDLVLQAVWETSESHDVGFAAGPRWMTKAGTTLVLDWATGRVLSLLCTESGERAQLDRRRTLSAWVEKGLLRDVGANGATDEDKGRVMAARRSPSGTRVEGSVRVICN